jgi:tetratricopeptide (TPR) repeat protein
LLPVIQLLPIGLAVASDRYTYVPLIGIFYVLSECIVWIWQNKLKNHIYVKIIVVILSLTIITELVFLTNGLCRVWKDGVTLWTNVVTHYPQTDVAYNNRGTEYFTLKEYDKALKDFLATIEINPTDAAAHSNACNSYFAQKENDKALIYCMKSLKINPAQPNTYAILGDIYWSDNKTLSIEMYKKSISLSSHYYSGYFRLCNAYLSLNKFEEAYPACLKAIEYNPDAVDSCNNFGNLYLQNKQYRKALSFYLKALSINQNIPEVHNNLAVLYYYMDDYKSAIKHYKKALSLGHKVDPDFQKLIEEHQKKTDGLKNDR